jgi:hypothetical protein
MAIRGYFKKFRKGFENMLLIDYLYSGVPGLINGNCSGTVSSCQAWVMPVVFNIDIGYKTLVFLCNFLANRYYTFKPGKQSIPAQ